MLFLPLLILGVCALVFLNFSPRYHYGFTIFIICVFVSYYLCTRLYHLDKKIKIFPIGRVGPHIGCFVLLPIGYTLGLWCTICVMLPFLYTVSLGSPNVIQVPAHVARSASSKETTYYFDTPFERQPIFEISYTTYQTYHSKALTLELDVIESDLGTYIQTVALLENKTSAE